MPNFNPKSKGIIVDFQKRIPIVNNLTPANKTLYSLNTLPDPLNLL